VKLVIKGGATQLPLTTPLLFEVTALSRVTAAEDLGVASTRRARANRMPRRPHSENATVFLGERTFLRDPEGPEIIRGFISVSSL
jgi:hypothetical protein